MAGTHYQQAVRLHYSGLSTHLQLCKVIEPLFTRRKITLQEKQDIEAPNVGNISKVGRLLDLVLRDNCKVQGFVDVLETEYNTYWKLIEDTAQKIVNREIPSHGSVNVIDLKSELKSTYKSQDCNIIERLPGEAFVLDINDPSLLLPVDASVEVVDWRDIKQKKTYMRIENINYKYRPVGLTCIEEVLEYERSERECILPPSRLFLCTGIAGSGKTVYAHRIVWQWVTDINEPLAKYDAVFLIPLRKVNCSSHFSDILTELGYIHEDKVKGALEELSLLHHHVLVLLDGVDEVDMNCASELVKLIKGEIYPHFKVLLIARPDASFLEKCRINFDGKVHIRGTTKDGIYNHIKSSLPSGDGGPSAKEVENIIKTCEGCMFHFELLYVPLYLELVTVLFNRCWLEQSTFKDFPVPQTISDLFSRFMNIIIRTWIERMVECKAENPVYLWHKSPLDNSSSVPVSIKRILYQIGKMSCHGLMRKQYNFKKSDLQNYFLDVKDIQRSGLLCCDTCEGYYFFKHKTIQEYLAAVYICHEKFNDGVFADHIRRPVQLGKDNCCTLKQLFSPLNLCMKMVAGICPELLEEILSTRKGSLGIVRGRSKFIKCLATDIVYEAELFCETNDKNIKRAIAEWVTHGRYHNQCTDIHEQSNNIRTVYKMTQELPLDMCQKILEERYDIAVSLSEGGSYEIRVSKENNGTDSKVVINCLDCTAFCLLQRFQFPSISSVTVKCSMIMNVRLLQRIFPNAQRFVISGFQVEDFQIGCQIEPETHVVSLSYNTIDIYTYLSESSVSYLLTAKQLEELHLHGPDMFHNMASVNRTPDLGSLQVLHIAIDDLCKKVDLLCTILRNTPQLSTLHLHTLDAMDELNVSDCLDLLNTIAHHIPNIRQLMLIDMFCSKSLKAAFNILPNLTSLQLLGLNQKDALLLPFPLIKTFKKCQAMQKLVVYHWATFDMVTDRILSDLVSTGNIALEYREYDRVTGEVFHS